MNTLTIVIKNVETNMVEDVFIITDWVDIISTLETVEDTVESFPYEIHDCIIESWIDGSLIDIYEASYLVSEYQRNGHLWRRFGAWIKCLCETLSWYKD